MTSRPTPRASAGGPARPLDGEDRAAAVARTYARGPRRLRLTDGQLRYIARQESARRLAARG